MSFCDFSISHAASQINEQNTLMIYQFHFCVGAQKVKRKKIKFSTKLLLQDSSLNQSVTFSSFGSLKQNCPKGLGYLSDVDFLCSFSSDQTDWQ